MKKYKSIIVTFLLATLFCACDVEVENPNSIPVKNHWKTETDAEYGVNAIYNMFYKPETYARWLWFRFDIASDEGFSQSPWAELKEWTQFQYGNYDFGEGNAWSYRDCYVAIYRANQVLHHVPDIPFQDPYKKERIIGQAHFLRGLYYYNLAILWGSTNKSLAINLEDVLPTPTTKPVGHTATEVFDQAIKDFTEAQRFLPQAWDGADLGRATKGAALAMRAKCYMQMHEWEKARVDLSWFVDGAGSANYDLMPKYVDNFLSKTENNIESVFEIQFSDIHGDPAGDGDNDVNPNLGLHRAQFFAPPGIGWNDAELRPWLVDEFKKEKDKNGNFDIRLKYTAFYENMHNDFADNTKIYDKVSDSGTWGQDNWRGRVFIRKYSSSDEREEEDYHNGINVRLIRFADILLMYAECIAETGGSIAEAVKHVDRVRARADMKPLADNHPQAATDKEAFLKRLQMERVLELSTEGHRWADIKRWGLLETKEGIEELKSRDADFNYFDVVNFAQQCMPIPSTEVANNPNIEQNPNF